MVLAARDVEASQLCEQVGVLEAVMRGRGTANSDAFAALSAALKQKDEAAAAAAANLAARPIRAGYIRVREQPALLKATLMGGDDEGKEGQGASADAGADSSGSSCCGSGGGGGGGGVDVGDG